MVSYKQHEDTEPIDLQANPPLPQIGKDEMNLCELPIAKLGRRDNRDVIEFTGEIVKDGKTITQEWVVSGTARVGLPTEFAERVLVALISIAASQGFEQKTTFTVYEVLKFMKMEISGFHYQEVTQAIKRLHGVTITSENSWWDNEKKKHCTISEGFHLIDLYWIRRMADETSETGGGWIIWNEWLWKSFQDGYIKNLDTAFYYGLDSTLARRLYRFLDKRMHYQDSYQIDIFSLAARLGMASYRYPSKVVEKLQPAFDELITRDYLASATVFKMGKFTRVKFVRVREKQAYQAALLEDTPETPTQIDTESHTGIKKPLGWEMDAEVQEGAVGALYGDYGTSEALKQAWQDILYECAGTMPSDSYRMIADSALLDVEGEGAVIAINAHSKDWIERQMRRKFLGQLSQYLGTRIREIRFIDNMSVSVEAE